MQGKCSGVDAINSQLFCMGMEKLGREYAGKITFRGEIDRQQLLPFRTEEEVRAGVRRAYHALCPDDRLIGCIAQCEWDLGNPEANIHAVYDEWGKIDAEQRKSWRTLSREKRSLPNLPD